MSQFLFILSGTVEEAVFQLNFQTLISVIAQLFNFLLLAFILTYLLYKPVRRFMSNRTERVAAQFEQAKQDTEKAELLKREYEEKMKVIEAERESIIDAARKTAAESGRQIVSDAKKEADELLVRAQANIALEMERAQEEMRLQIIQVSAAMTERFLVRNVSIEDQNRLFDETVAELEEMAWRS